MYSKSVLFCQVVSNVRYYSKSGSSKKLLEFLADMPKANSSRIAEAQRQRQNISKKSEKYGPSTVYLQVLGSGARGVPNTLYLFTNQKRYLFNCGECTQRLAHEHKVKLSRLEHIFITGKTWRNIGGLPGLSLTLQDVGVPNIVLHGPEGLDELYNATRRFVIMKDMQVTMAKSSPTEDYEDNVMTVRYVRLSPNDEILAKDPTSIPAAKRPKTSDSPDKELEKFIHDDTDYYRPEIRNFEHGKAKSNIPNPRNKQQPKLDTFQMKNQKFLHELLQKQTDCTVAYICTLKKRLGTLSLEKCVELGVKPGPLLGQLKNGQDVILSDGTLVRSKDVKTPDEPGPVFIVIEVPHLSYLKEKEFSAHFDNGVNPPENIPTLMVHYTPPDVYHSEAYQAFLKRFGTTTRHLVLNGQNSCLGSEAVHRTQHKLHLLDPDIFPLLKDVSVPAVWNAHPPVPKNDSPIRLKGLEELKNKIAIAQFQSIINMESSCKGDVKQQEEGAVESIAGRTLTMFHLRPKKQLDRSAEPKLHIQDYIQETMDVDGFVNSLEQFRRLVESMRYARTGIQKEYPKVVFLGTGSCIPSKTRNTSAIVLQIDEERSMLLDCGEGTFGQLVRFYGPKKVNSFLRTLKAIYISHLHADHHIGLIGVLQARKQAFEELNPNEIPDPVYLLAPGQIITWLSIYDQQFERIREDYSLIPNQSLLINTEGTPKENESQSHLTPALLAGMGVDSIETVYVAHCPNAFGVAIEVSGHKITYSGDTVPCEALVKLGHKSDLLIHEATMEDELADEARTKMHSTTTQAIEIGRLVNAKYTVLTHFSQRYARLPRLNANILNDNKSVGIAFDNMQITMSDLELLPHMYAPLQLMFAEHCVEMELKAAHRARQKERRSSTATDDGAEVAEQIENPRKPTRAGRRVPTNCINNLPKSCITTNRLCQDSRSKSPSPSKIPIRLSGSPRSGVSTPRSRPSNPGLDVTLASRTVSETSDISADRNRSSIVNSRSRVINYPRFEEGNKNCRKEASKVTVTGYVTTIKENGYRRPTDTPLIKRPVLKQDRSPKQILNIKNMPSPTKVSPQRRPTTPTKSPTPIKPTAVQKSTDSGTKRWNFSTHLRDNTVYPSANRPASKFGAPVADRRASPSPVRGSSVQHSNSAKMERCNTTRRAFSSLYILDSGHDSYTRIKSANASFSSPTKKNMPLNKKYDTTKHTEMKTQPSASILSQYQSGARKHNNKPEIRYIRPDNKPETRNIRPDNKPETRNIRPDNKSNNRDISPDIKINNRNIRPDNKFDNRNNIKLDNKSRNIEQNQQNSDSDSYSDGSRNRTMGSTSGRKQPSQDNIKTRMETLREFLNEAQSGINMKNIQPIPVLGRPGSSIRSNRSFKPQLEEIKSSLLLLNKATNSLLKETNVPKPILEPKPKPLDEAERRRLLKESRQKFQTKRFLADSKYDKIEGLNWISWKY